MDPTDPSPDPSRSLGEIIRAARQARNLSEDELGQPEFKACFIQAVEEGRVHPSPLALELFARRLHLPLELLRNAPLPVIKTPDLDALKEDLAYQIDCARRATDSGNVKEALRMLDEAEQAYEPYLKQLAGYTVYRLYYGRGVAYVRLRQPVPAQHDLEHALALARALAKRLPERAEAVEQARNALGAAFYQQDDLYKARAYHEQCLHAIQTGVIRDLNLRLLIYSNLANDYWALNDIDHAIGMYQEALKLLEEDISNQERRLGIYWGLSMAYKAKQDWGRAYLYARRALDVCEATRNEYSAAQLWVNLAEVLIELTKYEEAERLLAQALAYQKKNGDTLSEGVVYQQFSLLELAKKHIDQAKRYARLGLGLIEELYQALDPHDPHAHANTIRAYAQALRVAGQVAEGAGDLTTADAYFLHAVAVMEPLTPHEAGYETCCIYAELLDARGDKEGAAKYYRLADTHRRRPPPNKGKRAVR